MQTILMCPCFVHETLQGSGTFLHAKVATFTSGTTAPHNAERLQAGYQAFHVLHAAGNNCCHPLNTQVVQHSKCPDYRSTRAGTGECVASVLPRGTGYRC